MFALLATLLLALMPTVARAINGDNLLIQSLCTADGTTRLVVDTANDPEQPHSAAHLEKCGYCTLLSQLPTLPLFAQPALTLPRVSSVVPPRAPTPQPANDFAWPAAQPRAPPL